MTTIIIEENSLQAKQLLAYLRTLPFATVVDEPKKKKGFAKAAKACKAVTVDTFIGELRRQINQWPDDNV